MTNMTVKQYLGVGIDGSSLMNPSDKSYISTNESSW